MPRSAIIRSDDLRSQNRRRLLETLRSRGACTPADLSDLTGLSSASISTLSSQMIDQGILLSDKHPDTSTKNARGRPRSQLSLNPSAGDIITVCLTIDRIRVQRVNYAGDVLRSEDVTLDTRALSADQLLNTTINAIENSHPAAGHSLQHIGVSFQGVTEHASGDLLWSPIISQRNVPIGQSLLTRFGVENSVSNDCQLISLALSKLHSDTLGPSFATVLFSHGIGLGLFLDGQPFAGIRSSALELGHLRFEHKGALCRCGKRGCIEAYAADYGIERMAYGQSLDDVPAGRIRTGTMQHMIDQAQQGECAAVQAFTIAGAAIGEGLSSLFTLLDPIPVALVGRSDQAFALMQDGINTILQQNLREGIDIDGLLHCFDSEESLLDQGLVFNTLSQVDQLFSDPTFDISATA